jgi:hypothetical protein
VRVECEDATVRRKNCHCFLVWCQNSAGENRRNSQWLGRKAQRLRRARKGVEGTRERDQG